jgi:hypothetical protein
MRSKALAVQSILEMTENRAKCWQVSGHSPSSHVRIGPQRKSLFTRKLLATPEEGYYASLTDSACIVFLSSIGAKSALAEGDLQKVNHIIIVMQENHSFDNYFGALAYADRLSTPSHFPRHSPRDRRKQEKDGVHPRMDKSVSPSAAARERFMLESQERGESVGHEQN